MSFPRFPWERRKEILFNLYINKRMSIYKIAKAIGLGKTQVHVLLCEFEIPRRTISESKKGELHPLYGKHLSSKHRNKISETMKLREIRPRAMSKEKRKELSILLSKKFSGNGNPFYGEHHSKRVINVLSKKAKEQANRNGGKAIIFTPEIRKKISDKNRGKKRSDETKEYLRQINTGKKHSEETKNKMRGKKHSIETIQKMKKVWTEERRALQRDIMIKRLSENGMPTSMTRPERRFISEYIEPLNLPIKYVGNGDVWIGNCNPDFINTNGKKEVYEIFGRVVHTILHKERYNYTEKGRTEHFKKYGFNCIVIWDDELSNRELVLKKLGTV